MPTTPCPAPLQYVGPIVLALALAACGGGGDDAPAPPPPAPAPVETQPTPVAQPPVTQPPVTQPPVTQPPVTPPPSGLARLAIEAGATNPSITLSADGLQVAFGNTVNPDCQNRVGIYAAPEFADSVACHKRAVRTNVGIKQGEFRYYEGHRLVAPANIGFGYTTAGSPINPYCCLVDPNQPISSRTPPSMSINTLGGTYVQLRNTGGFDVNATAYYGFAVDYRGANPVVYVVTMDGTRMSISRQVTNGFNGADVMPFAYGHTDLTPVAGTPVAAYNFGQSAFNYNLTTLQSELTMAGVTNVSQMVSGVGTRP